MIWGGGGGGHVKSALDLVGSHEFHAGLAPVFRPTQHFSNEHSLICTCIVEMLACVVVMLRTSE